MSEKSDLIDEQVAACRERDLERFLGYYAADTVIRDLDGNVLMNGRQAMREQYGQLFRDSPALRINIPRRTEVGDYVVDEEQISGFRLAGFPTAMRAVVIYRVQHGKINQVVLVS
jgi:hypothetical protein